MTRWWLNEAASYRELAIVPGHTLAIGYPADSPLVFYGHDWQTAAPRDLAQKVACVDYSAGVGGKLTACQWSSKSSLRQENFIQV